MTEIVVATTNEDKLREIGQIFAGVAGIRFIPQHELAVTPVEETEPTFVENAILKARHACIHTGLAAIADDSGLVVDALHGAPGIYSARYAGVGATYADNIAKLLRELRAVPEAQRTARFHCVIVYLRYAADPVPLICHGVWEGRILSSVRGSNGFGYDPVFWVSEQNCSAAELPSEVKNHLSHRGQALYALRGQLCQEI